MTHPSENYPFGYCKIEKLIYNLFVFTHAILKTVKNHPLPSPARRNRGAIQIKPRVIGLSKAVYAFDNPEKYHSPPRKRGGDKGEGLCLATHRESYIPGVNTSIYQTHP
jgi:hypothetical protein